MHIDHLRVEDFPGLADGEYAMPVGKTVVVTGPAGSGKTAFLRAICAAKEGAWAYGSSFAAPTLPPGGTARVGSRWGFTPEEVDRFGLGDATFDLEVLLGSSIADFADERLQPVFGTFDPSPRHPKLELFHAERGMVGGGSWPAASRPTSQEVASRLRSDNRRYANLVVYAVEAWEGGRGDELAAAFSSLCDTARLVAARRTAAGAEVTLRVGSVDVPLDEASASEREAFLFAATFLRSGLRGSVILVDVPERFLAPPVAARFVEGLAELGEDNQLVVATASNDLAGRIAGAATIRLNGRAR